MKKEPYLRPSVDARLRLLEQGGDTVDIISWSPAEPNCVCSPLIRKQIQEGSTKHITCPASEAQGMKKFKIICKKCGELLATFSNIRADLKAPYCDLHFVCGYTKDKWFGCLGININPYTAVVNFECACGHKAIKEPSLGGVPRYTEYEIKKDNRK